MVMVLLSVSPTPSMSHPQADIVWVNLDLMIAGLDDDTVVPVTNLFDGSEEVFEEALADRFVAGSDEKGWFGYLFSEFIFSKPN